MVPPTGRFLLMLQIPSRATVGGLFTWHSSLLIESSSSKTSLILLCGSQYRNVFHCWRDSWGPPGSARVRHPSPAGLGCSPSRPASEAVPASASCRLMPPGSPRPLIRQRQLDRSPWECLSTRLRGWEEKKRLILVLPLPQLPQSGAGRPQAASSPLEVRTDPESVKN